MTIRTTHVGSLPRSTRVADLLFAREKGMKLDEAAYDQVMMEETAAIIARQREALVDLPSDGETSKISYATYIKDRLHGFDGDSPRRPRRTSMITRPIATGWRGPAARPPIAAPNVWGQSA